ncbi:hypothetical protein H257_16445 [Aphanomyces astaci]|uniref:EF-hand domain-containing protein n=2 Tax=Aphanomyces astaci TaxID=112090 RepID=W4FKG5_APHAT|nr:hypothetical protein H257_16445 [Aphanomyces astaci]ETV67361.1 hypothetical protein H257_16445 [Aphanomyces astaci]|eukprot:XP_009843176.1 hypothetical protein H257_16445 [Aphanomyces astaci]
MRAVQKPVYLVQLYATKVTDEIAHGVHSLVQAMALNETTKLAMYMEHLLATVQSTQMRLYRSHSPTRAQVEANVPLHLFVFTLQSYVATLIEFEALFNGKTRLTRARVVNFVQNVVASYINPDNYSREKLTTAAKVAMAILIACFLSVFTFGYSSTTAGAVAYVMGNHIGGSFSVTANRVGGVITGSIIPSICLFYICSFGCGSNIVVLAVTNSLLFVWVTFSMYIKWKGGFESYAGLISAFTATQVLLKGCDGCEKGSVAPISSYSNLAQMSLGIVLFIIVEMAICPQSAMALLRANIQKQMKLYQQCFQVLVQDTLARDGAVATEDEDDEATASEIKAIVKKKLPALLVEQAALLKEAAFEPLLWKPPFSTQKYEAVLDCCQRLLNNTLVLFKLTQWYKHRMNLQHPSASPSSRPPNTPPTSRFPTKMDVTKALVNTTVPDNEVWGFSTAQASRAIHDTFDTLHDLFGESFTYADGDQTALFMQMKEAFRLADKDCSGEIDADEVKSMLEMIFAQSGAVKVDAIDSYVAEFMEIVDSDKSGKVSLEEFIDALEHGLQLQVEVFQHRSTTKKKYTSVSKTTATIEPVLAPIAEDEVPVAPPPLAILEDDHMAGPPIVMLEVPPLPSSEDDVEPTRKLSSSSAVNDASQLTRSHDLLLSVDSLALVEVVQDMRSQYASWMLQDHRYTRLSVEEILVLNCLVSGVSGFARNLALLEEMSVLQ